jgi:tellurite resistance protein TerC
MTEATLRHWVFFAAVLAGGLVLDLAVFSRPRREPQLKSALIESLGWILLSCAFGAWVYASLGRRAGVEFFTAYVVEKSLSIDNIFVFLLVFETFQVARRLQHRALFYGIGGALVMRGAFIVAGVELLEAFHPIVYVLGGILLVAGIRMLFSSRRALHPERNWLVRVAKRFFPVTETCEEDRFLVRRAAGMYATPLLLALVAVEAMDIVFAVDSVPAVLAITRDTFLAYSSNAFAILGLRALYFAVADMLPRLRFLHQGLAAILAAVGGKMLLSDKLAIPEEASLGVLGGILVITLAASWLAPKKA